MRQTEDTVSSKIVVKTEVFTTKDFWHFAAVSFPGDEHVLQTPGNKFPAGSITQKPAHFHEKRRPVS